MMEELFLEPIQIKSSNSSVAMSKQEIDLQGRFVVHWWCMRLAVKNIKIKSEVAERILQQLPETMRYVESYAEDAMDVRNDFGRTNAKIKP